MAGYTRPFTPNGEASMLEPLPWRFAGNLLLFHFRADPDAIAAYLPEPLTPSDPPDEAYVWSPHLKCYPEGVEPADWPAARSHYDVAVIGLPCRLHGERTMFSTFQWCNRDWLVLLSWFLGACSKLAEIETSGLHPLLPGMTQDGGVGTRLKRVVSRNGEAVMRMEFEPQRAIDLAELEFYTRNLPLTCMRHVPDCHVPPLGKPLVHDLTQMVMSGLEQGETLAGEGTLEFCPADNEELMPLAPKEVLGAYWMPMGFLLDGVRIVHQYDAAIAPQ
ncbi:MAG: hypothetical protein F4Y31_04425 [Gammaproteobacteria bacterium]|nr:hypothetical protein [Gammaproteobacteria bacterium]MYF68176.1 hypothetical protein [Gammaproteobacteria bacterium]MYK37444.1 hypothetical protein [Gammaproteobacteria bacterium]